MRVLLLFLALNFGSAWAQHNCPPNLDHFFEVDSNYLELLTSDEWTIQCVSGRKFLLSIIIIQKRLEQRMEYMKKYSSCKVHFNTTDPNVDWWFNVEDGFLWATFNYNVESYRYEFVKVTADFILLDVYVPKKPFKHSAPYSKWKYKETWYLTRE